MTGGAADRTSAAEVLRDEARRYTVAVWLLALLVLVAFIVSLLIGPAGLSPAQSIAALLGGGGSAVMMS